MGKILEFRPDRHADIEKLLRELFEPERELDREVDPEIVRRAKEIPEWMSLLPPIQPIAPRGSTSRRERRRRTTGSRRPLFRFEQ